jgi:electron transfer flavoprotein alpha subunit
MERILLLLHTEPDGRLAKSAIEAAGAARSLSTALLGSSLTAAMVGRDVQGAADQIAALGAGKIFGVAGEAFGECRYATDAAAAEAACRAAGATMVIAPHTSRWGRCLSGVAQRLEGRIDTHVTAISAEGGSLAVTRWYYRQRMEAVLARAQRPWIILLDPGSQPAWQGDAALAAVEALDVALPADAKRTRNMELRAPKADQQTIRPDAELLFVAGAGWTKKQSDGKIHVDEAASIILQFLRKTQASLGSSKSLVDLGGEGQTVLPFLSHLNQVGQTGSTPRHPKGLSTCCHGEEPHVVGWRFVNERRAVNLDPNCGWARGKADVLYVADAFDVIARVNELLKQDS